MQDSKRSTHSLSVVRRSLNAWFERPLGRSLLANESLRLRNILPTLYGTVAIQLGRAGRIDLLESCSAPTRVVMDLPAVNRSDFPAGIMGESEQLPFDSRSVDVALLPHTLEFSSDPHQVLREVQRVLSPEGHLIVLGFNPLSLWGARRLVARRSATAPWCGQFISLPRMKDWLKLLEFDLVQGAMLYYRPPMANERVMERLHFLDKVGDRWWPMAGAVYLIVAKKRVVGMTPLRPEWRAADILRNSAARPVAFAAGTQKSATIIRWPYRVARRRTDRH